MLPRWIISRAKPDPLKQNDATDAPTGGLMARIAKGLGKG